MRPLAQAEDSWGRRRLGLPLRGSGPYRGERHDDGLRELAPPWVAVPRPSEPHFAKERNCLPTRNCTSHVPFPQTCSRDKLCTSFGPAMHKLPLPNYRGASTTFDNGSSYH